MDYGTICATSITQKKHQIRQRFNTSLSLPPSLLTYNLVTRRAIPTSGPRPLMSMRMLTMFLAPVRVFFPLDRAPFSSWRGWNLQPGTNNKNFQEGRLGDEFKSGKKLAQESSFKKKKKRYTRNNNKVTND